MATLLPVDEAIALLRAAAKPLEAVERPLAQLLGQVAAEPLRAAITQPPHPASAMDGWAVCSADARQGARLQVVGEAPAGRPWGGTLAPGETVRIFTGGVLPAGADHVVIQEDARRDGDQMLITAPQQPPRHVRAAGIDFRRGDELVAAGTRLGPAHLGLLAAANRTGARVVRRPRVALFTAGDELRDPGADLAPGEVVNANHHALVPLVARWGGEPDYRGCAADSPAAIAALFDANREADLLVPVGGASVGDHDHMRAAFTACGGSFMFEKVAVRPGKPTWFGRLGTEGPLVLGLPGNPTSALVTAHLFLQPLVRWLSGEPLARWPATRPARLAVDLQANGPRETWWRGLGSHGADGVLEVRRLARQDSSLLSTLAAADLLLRVPAQAPAQPTGSLVQVLALG